MAARSSDHSDAMTCALLDSTSLAGGCSIIVIRLPNVPSDARGDYSPSTAILRV
jgi:hypothetical protein